MRTKAAAVVWLLVLLGAGVWLSLRFEAGPVVNADLLSLLPRTSQLPAVQAVADKVITAQQRKLLLVVSATEEGAARKAAQSTYDVLSQSGLFDRLDLRRSRSQLEELGQFYFPYRFQLMSEETRRQLLTGDIEAFERRLLARYLNPLGGTGSALIEADPLLLFSGFLTSLRSAAAPNLSLRDGFLTVQDQTGVHILILGRLAASPFSLSYQADLVKGLQAVRARLVREGEGASLLTAGVFPYAAAGTSSARGEVSTVGVGSLLGILLLFLIVFRSLRPFLLAALAIATGCLAGFAACLAIFGQVHLLTLVFGASLVGISVDYAFHYFCAALEKAPGSSRSALADIFPGITLGLVTSVIGFLGILLAPFPGLREMAVFSSLGLVGAWLTVVILFPHFAQGGAKPSGETDDGPASQALSWSEAAAGLWRRRRGRGASAALALCLIAVAGGSFKLVLLDDFRLLQARDRTVEAEETRIREILGEAPASQFFIVSGENEDALLAREEALIEALLPLRQSGKLGSLTALSRFVPSPARQAENRSMIGQLLSAQESPFNVLEDKLGLPASLKEAYEADFVAAGPKAPLALSDWLASPLSEPFRALWLGGKDEVYSVVTLSGAIASAALGEVARDVPGVHFIDRAGELSEIFVVYRDRTLWLTLLSYIAVAAVLALRYGLRGAVGVMAVPVAAGLVALGALGYLSEPVSLFNVMALLLILGIGVDYAIFFREAGGVKASTLLAVALSAATTLLAFGLLSLSATQAIHSFGVTLLIGIAAAFLLAPFSASLFKPVQARADLGGVA